MSWSADGYDGTELLEEWTKEGWTKVNLTIPKRSEWKVMVEYDGRKWTYEEYLRILELEAFI